MKSRHFPSEFSTLSGSSVPYRQSDVFYRRNRGPCRTPPETTTVSRILPSRVLGPVIWAIRPPAARQITVLSERPWLLSRARGGVRLRNARQYRGIDVTDGGRDGNLRQIRRCCFSNSQHYRESDVPHRQSDVFYRQSSGPCRTPPENGNSIEDSTI